ncbi:specifically androgen-regulated gene protein [Thamnophis elegans]|uniref:specifically androgen-regulated gene protein n=1 Tax=Thamnophis elegans TaxID=35005 RepID=UPI0013785A18|nr:specifically androgen-regulated gene protein [Thamnophis elegans]XP_032074100.1 specifically androgen-regulated gene protein [Thamnophis elegans]XP_032074101.1 specifically androgen-regulated gene protein [Thamnophis elegans]XP_032074102.1 specifically androgen-regulated gene protein [Thamnophis elegans]XP_032074103.1 specifically androgen-regulated gene protein [Thamnophis elegans]XP_032074104.1 specifically androgen-regulated gene protein [Thamnophis elegans]XP_032074105.1 specifically a
MPKKDLWVGIVEPDPTPTVDSAGSCDSVISNNSSSFEMNDGGFDYLTVEEKECLMFLEETLHSLDAEADSGVSADEAEAVELSKLTRTWPTRDVPKELDPDYHGKHKQIDPKGNTSLSGSIPAAILSPGHHSLPKNIMAKNTVHTSKIFVAEAPETNADDLKTLPPLHPTLWDSSKHGTLDILKEVPEIGTQGRISELESVVIPPPEPFQDQRKSHLLIEHESILTDSWKHAENGATSHYESKGNQGVMEEYEARAVKQEFPPEMMETAAGNESFLKSVSPKCNKKSSEQIVNHQEIDHKHILEESQLDSSFKQGPPIAPKPRKLPPNIILKTSKNNVAPLNIDPTHKIKASLPFSGRPRAATGDFSMDKTYALQKEQGRARREALEKLGLPLDNEKNPDDQVIKTSIYSKTRETSYTGSRENVNIDDITLSKKCVQQSDQTDVKEVQPTEISIQRIKQANFKSNTLERSGVGLSSLGTSGSEGENLKNNKRSFLSKITPNFLRNNRMRPASLGTGKDFVDLKENKQHHVEWDKGHERRSYPLQHPSKLPRPACVSVKITPKGDTEEHRKEALKKLGLLKEQT